jgi:hypothetical protein
MAQILKKAAIFWRRLARLEGFDGFPAQVTQ